MAGARRFGVGDGKFRVRQSTDAVRQPVYFPPIEAPRRPSGWWWAVTWWAFVTFGAAVVAAWIVL